MGRASSGGSCPLCGNHASRTVTGKLYPAQCSPKDWAHCIRPPLQLATKEARNEE